MNYTRELRESCARATSLVALYEHASHPFSQPMIRLMPVGKARMGGAVAITGIRLPQEAQRSRLRPIMKVKFIVELKRRRRSAFASMRGWWVVPLKRRRCRRRRTQRRRAKHVITSPYR